MGCLGIVVCAFSRRQTRNALSKNIVAQVRDDLVVLIYQSIQMVAVNFIKNFLTLLMSELI